MHNLELTDHTNKDPDITAKQIIKNMLAEISALKLDKYKLETELIKLQNQLSAIIKIVN